jgi:hypothetical protein
MPTKMHLCNECNQCSSRKPQQLSWGHECWAYTKDGKYRIVECESHIEELPVVDSLMLEAAASNPATQE